MPLRDFEKFPLGKILIVGTVRNLQGSLSREIRVMQRAFTAASNIDFYLVESDSTDSTVSELQELEDKIRNFSWVSLGILSHSLPNRIERLRKCRNEYVSYIRNNILRNQWDYVVVADLDGVNSALSAESVNNLIPYVNRFDIFLPNQTRGYYDLLALRHEYWMPNNCFQELNWRLQFLNAEKGFLGSISHWVAKYRLRSQIIYSRMLNIPSSAQPIEVSSGFGGLGVYRSELFRECDYSALGEKSYECEHVDFNLKLSGKGYRFAIIPNFINSHWNTYNINKIPGVRILRGLLRSNYLRIFVRR